MKVKLSLLVSLAVMMAANAAKLTKKEYDYKYEVGSHRGDGDTEAVANCLRNWGKHPFGKTPSYRRMRSGVKVFGIGSKGFIDEDTTSWPQLILVAPGVNVLGKATYRLLNPKGWYCIKSNVTVLSKSAIEVGCDTHLTSSGEGAEVLGSGSDHVKGGVVVLGKIEVKKVGACAR